MGRGDDAGSGLARADAVRAAVGHLRAALVLLDGAGETLAAIDVSHALSVLGHDERAAVD